MIFSYYKYCAAAKILKDLGQKLERRSCAARVA